MTSSVPSHKLKGKTISQDMLILILIFREVIQINISYAHLPCHHWENSNDTIWCTKSNKRTITNTSSIKELHAATAREIGKLELIQCAQILQKYICKQNMYSSQLINLRLMQNYVTHVVTNFHQELRQLINQLFDTFKWKGEGFSY